MKIGTRGSELALWQARLVRALLQEKASLATELVIIKTQGDRDQSATFDKMEGKGFFTKEIEAALLDHSVDLAVHSLKDLQTTMPPGLALGALLHRADRRDMILMRPEAVDDSLILHLRVYATVGTTSARRVAQLLNLRPISRWFRCAAMFPHACANCAKGNMMPSLLPPPAWIASNFRSMGWWPIVSPKGFLSLLRDKGRWRFRFATTMLKPLWPLPRSTRPRSARLSGSSGKSSDSSRADVSFHSGPAPTVSTADSACGVFLEVARVRNPSASLSPAATGKLLPKRPSRF